MEARVMSTVNLTHPALADGRNDFIRPEFVTRNQCHEVCTILAQ